MYNLTVHSEPVRPLVSLSIFLCPKSSLTLHSHLSISYLFLFTLSWVFPVDVSFLFIFPVRRTFFSTSSSALHIHVPTTLGVYILCMLCMSVCWVFVFHVCLHCVFFRMFLVRRRTSYMLLKICISHYNKSYFVVDQVSHA